MWKRNFSPWHTTYLEPKKLEEKHIPFKTILNRFFKASIVDNIVSLEMVKTPVIKLNQNTWHSTSGVYIQKLSKKESLIS